MHVRKTSWASLLIVVAVVAACGRPAGSEARAREVERRILAPCCKRQTLEDHESEVARELRLEIERRVSQGEAAAIVEDDLVRRYGEDVRAMPRGEDPRALLGGAVAGALAVGGLALAWLVRRRPDASSAGDARHAQGARDADYEDRLDDELLAVD